MAIDRLETKIAYARAKLELLRSLVDKEDLDDLEYVAFERCVEILVQTIINVSIWSTRFNRMEVPRTNRRIIQQMDFIDKFEPGFIEKLSLIGGLRNIIVHEYSDIDQELVLNTGEQLVSDFPIFIDIVLEFVETRKSKNNNIDLG